MSNWKVLSLRAELEVKRALLTNAEGMTNYWASIEQELYLAVEKLERELIDLGEAC